MGHKARQNQEKHPLILSPAYLCAMTDLWIWKTGGEVLDHPARRLAALDAFASLNTPRIWVHGGGKKGTEVAQKLGVETQMVDGRRITSEEMLEVAAMVYGGLLNRKLVADLAARGVPALGVTGADLDLIRATKRPVKEIDYGWVGDITAVQVDAWEKLLSQGISPILAPLTHDGQGHLLNTNADTMASSVATALSGQYRTHLVFVFDYPGVMLDLKDPESLVKQIKPADYQQLKLEGKISGGMLPKLDNAFAALEKGVTEVILCEAAALANLTSANFQGTRILK